MLEILPYCSVTEQKNTSYQKYKEDIVNILPSENRFHNNYWSKENENCKTYINDFFSINSSYKL